jgi:uncharacterized membrane protein
MAAPDRRRVSLPGATVGALAELLALSAGAGLVVAAADAARGRLPSVLRPGNPVVTGLGVAAAGMATTLAVRRPRVQAWLSLPSPDGAQGEATHFIPHRNLPMAVAGSAAVAAAAVGVARLETWTAAEVARMFSSKPDPGSLAELVGQAAVSTGVALAGLAAFTLYSSRVSVQQSVFESAYAEIPTRGGVTGGPGSGLAFGQLGREGRRFVSQAYTADELGAVLGCPAADPVRAMIPVSALTGDDARDAAAVVAEIERLGGFTKGTIVLAAPTGNGYVSYVQTETVELVTKGDCTTVAVGYSILPSVLAITRRARASAAYAAYARAVAQRARELNPGARLYVFGESLGSIIALDAFGPDFAQELTALGFSGGLFVGVPIFSRTDQALRPRDPAIRENDGLQYATGRDQANHTHPGYLNLTHPTDPLALADFSSFLRHGLDYWGRPRGAFVPLVSFLVNLADVKNAMSLRPGEFRPSPGHDYRYDTALAVARAYGLPFDREELVEAALRERELAWSVRRLLARRFADARAAVLRQLRDWGVDPATLSARSGEQRRAVAAWVDSLTSSDTARSGTDPNAAPTASPRTNPLLQTKDLPG